MLIYPTGFGANGDPWPASLWTPNVISVGVVDIQSNLLRCAVPATSGAAARVVGKDPINYHHFEIGCMITPAVAWSSTTWQVGYGICDGTGFSASRAALGINGVGVIIFPGAGNSLRRTVASAETILNNPGDAPTTGTTPIFHRIRCQYPVWRTKLWLATSPEPAAWNTFNDGGIGWEFRVPFFPYFYGGTTGAIAYDFRFSNIYIDTDLTEPRLPALVR